MYITQITVNCEVSEWGYFLWLRLLHVKKKLWMIQYKGHTHEYKLSFQSKINNLIKTLGSLISQ